LSRYGREEFSEEFHPTIGVEFVSNLKKYLSLASKIG